MSIDEAKRFGQQPVDILTFADKNKINLEKTGETRDAKEEVSLNNNPSPVLMNKPYKYDEIEQIITVDRLLNTEGYDINQVQEIKPETYGLKPEDVEKTYIGKVRNNFLVDVKNSTLDYKEKEHFNLKDGDKVIYSVASNRTSAFNVPVLIPETPYKGAVLNSISDFIEKKILTPLAEKNKDWNLKFDTVRWDLKYYQAVPLADRNSQAELVIRKALTPIKLEMVARKYLTGTTDTSISHRYFVDGERKFDDITLPENMNLHDELSKTILTPTTKDKDDRNLSNDEAIEELKRLAEGNEELSLAIDKVGGADKLYAKMKEITIKSLNAIDDHYKHRGLVFPDLKLEFGVDKNGDLYLMDEKGSPDNLRIWNKESLKAAQEENKRTQDAARATTPQNNIVKFDPKKLAQVELSYDKDYLRKKVNSSKEFGLWKKTPAKDDQKSVLEQIEGNKNHIHDGGFKAYKPSTLEFFPLKKVAEYANMLLYINSFMTGRSFRVGASK